MLAERLQIKEVSSQSKLKITLDTDGVLTDVDLIIIKLFNKKFGTNYQLKDLIDWNIVYKWAKKEGLSDEKATALQSSYWYETPEIHRNARIMSGAFSLARKLSESPLVDLHIRTSRQEDKFKEPTRLWFNENLPFIDHKIITVGNKVDEIIKINPDIHIEDSPKDAETIINNTKAYVIMVPYAYNYGKFKHERVLEYDPEEVNLNFLPTLWPIYRLFERNNLF